MLRLVPKFPGSRYTVNFPNLMTPISLKLRSSSQ